MKIDMHCHTHEGSSCATITIEDVVRTAVENDLDGVLICDHETIQSYKLYKESNPELPIKLFAGFEYTTLDGDFIVILPTDDECISYDRHMTAEKLIDIVHSMNGVIGIAHMYRDIFSVGNIVDKEKLKTIISLVDFIETQNARTSSNLNKKAKVLAEENKKYQTAGSDAHELGEVGKKYTIFPSEIQFNSELVEVIRKGLL